MYSNSGTNSDNNDLTYNSDNGTDNEMPPPLLNREDFSKSSSDSEPDPD